MISIIKETINNIRNFFKFNQNDSSDTDDDSILEFDNDLYG